MYARDEDRNAIAIYRCITADRKLLFFKNPPKVDAKMNNVTNNYFYRDIWSRQKILANHKKFREGWKGINKRSIFYKSVIYFTVDDDRVSMHSPALAHTFALLYSSHARFYLQVEIRPKTDLIIYNVNAHGDRRGGRLSRSRNVVWREEKNQSGGQQAAFRNDTAPLLFL